MTEDFLEAVVSTTGVRGAAIRDVLNRGGSVLMEDGYVVITLQILSSPDFMNDSVSPGLIRLCVHVEATDGEGDDVPPVAEEIQAAVVARLRAALLQLLNKNADALRDTAAASEQRLTQTRQRVERLLATRRELTESAGRVFLEPQAVRDELRELEAQRRDLEIERVGQQARRAALEQQIAAVASKGKDATKDDEVAAQLLQVVDLRAKQVARLEALTAANVSEMEVMSAKETLAEAQARLAMRKQELADRAGGETLAQLNRELSELSVVSTELEARSEFIKRQIEQLTPLIRIAERLETEVELVLPAAREMLANETARHDAIMAQLGTLRPPSLDVIGDADRNSGTR